ncbi:MAG: hypothetical protein KIT43_14615 [Bauldia sp.]|nr:hypothetical protein [Bauldia sp.]
MHNYLDTVFRGADFGHLAIFNKRTKQTMRVGIQEASLAEAQMRAIASKDDVYFGWGLVGDATGRGRGKSADVVAVGGFLCDVDCRSAEPGVHSRNEQLPESWEEVFDHLTSIGFPEPTAIRHSGNGAYFDYLFDGIWDLRTPEEHARGTRLSERFQRAFIDAAKTKGWHLDYVGDLARITRLPGTWNHKTQPPKAVQLIRHDDDLRFSLSDVEELIADLEKRLGRSLRTLPAKKAKIEALPQDGEPELSKPNFRSVVAGCRWARWLLEHAAHVPEPDWYAMASIAGRCHNGSRHFHELSKQDPRYEEGETEEKLHRAMTEAGPRTCANIADGLGFEGCKACPFSGRAEIGTPLSLGYTSPGVAGLMAAHVFELESGRYWDLTTRRPLDEKTFTNKFRHITGDTTPHYLVISDKRTRKIARTDYLPGRDELFVVNDDGEEALNLWRRSGAEPAPGDASLITKHLEYLIPDETERKHLLDALAHAVQKPEEKIRHVLLIIGRQGTGKSFVGTLLRSVVGDENAFVAESSDLTSEWTAQMGNRQAVILEELGVFEKREVYETLKRWVTDEFVTVNEKHVKKYRARTPKLMMAFSNHESPIALSDGDRRFWVCRSPAEPLDAAYYRRLFTEGLAQVPAFLDQLLNRDVSGFEPSKAPPSTTAKESILRWSLPVVQQEVEAMIEAEADPFHVDLFTLEDLRLRIFDRLKRLPTIREVTSAVKELGADQVRQIRKEGSGRLRIWAWRNVDQWKQATAAEIRMGLLRPLFLEAAE